MIRPFTLCCLTLSGFLCGIGVQAQVVLNEVSASNLTATADNFGEFEDWVELFNPTGAAVDISGWYLSDSQNNPLKWQFPPGTMLAANGYQLVYCSGRNTAVAPFHTSFKLNQTQQERIVLSDLNGTLVDVYQLQDPTKTNGSRGRTTDGAATWSLFQTPTPGTSNTGASAEYTARPQLSPAAGFYGGAQAVTMTSPVAGATIRYTLDGTTPTATSTLYAGPVNIAATTVVRAIAFDPNAAVPPSFIETNTYFINVNHTVPVISASGDQVTTLLNGNGGIQPLGVLEYFSASGQLLDEAVGEFNEHGQDSWAYDQRGVDYVARDQTGYNDGINYPIFRTKSRDHYQRVIIKAAAGDNYEFGPGQPAHIRDAYVQALSQVGDLKLDERSYEPCVMYVNGQYWGVYDIREKVDDSDFTNYYYGQDEFNIQYLKTWGGTWEEYGGAQAATDWDALRNYIATNNMGDPAAFAYVDSQFNWESLVDYFCLNSYTVCADWLNWNTGWWRGLDPNGDKKKWRYTLWDMDATFGHYTNFTGIPDQSPNADPCAVEDLPNPGGQGHTEILEKLVLENQMVHDYYVNRYIDLGNSLFNCNFMLPFLDSLVANIAPEMPGQIARWGGSVADWQANVQILRDFIETRCVTIEAGLVDCYDLTGPFDVVFMVDPPLSGEIAINSLTPSVYPFTGTYYGGINTTLAALPTNGWAFSHWEILNDTLQPSLTDSLVNFTVDVPDTVIAHFVPPTSYDVYLDVFPPRSGSIVLGTDLYDILPTIAQVPEGVLMPLQVIPAPFHEFLYWDILNNTVVPDDSSLMDLQVIFYTTDTIIAHLKPDIYGFYVPNSFTPNDDGINDVWLPLGNAIDVTQYELQVFDRWGELILTSNDPFKGWDGTIGGRDAQVGVYVYRLSVVDAVLNEKHDLAGHVTLFK